MKTTQELTLKIEDLEERIAPHLTILLPDASAVEGDKISQGTHSHLHGTMGPGAETFIRPHF